MSISSVTGCGPILSRLGRRGNLQRYTMNAYAGTSSKGQGVVRRIGSNFAEFGRVGARAGVCSFR